MRLLCDPAHARAAITLGSLPDDLIRSTIRIITDGDHSEQQHRQTAVALSLVAKRYTYVARQAMLEGGVEVWLDSPAMPRPGGPKLPPRRLTHLLRWLRTSPDMASLITSLTVKHMPDHEAEQWAALVELLGLIGEDLRHLKISWTLVAAIGRLVDRAGAELRLLQPRHVYLELSGGEDGESWDPVYTLLDAVGQSVERVEVGVTKMQTSAAPVVYTPTGGFDVDLPHLRRLSLGGRHGQRWARLAAKAPRLDQLDVIMPEVATGVLDDFSDAELARIRHIDVRTMPMARVQPELALGRLTNLVELRIIDELAGGKVQHLIPAPLPSLERLIIPANMLVSRPNETGPLFTAFLNQAMLNVPPDVVDTSPAVSLAAAIADGKSVPALRTVRITDMPVPDRDWIDGEDQALESLRLLRSLQLAPRARYDREVAEIGKALDILRPVCTQRGVHLIEDAV